MAVRVGVIGAGAYAQRAHLPPLREHPDAEIAALCRRNPVRLAEAADAFDVPGRYTSYTDLLADDSLDAVTISLPHNLHYEAAPRGAGLRQARAGGQAVDAAAGPRERTSDAGRTARSDADGGVQPALRAALHESARTPARRRDRRVAPDPGLHGL